MRTYKESQIISEENAIMSISILSVLGDRKDQQDSFAQLCKLNEGLVVVCDGMGGHEGGQIASELASELFINKYSEKFPISSPCDLLVNTVKECDNSIKKLTNSDGTMMNAGSTCVALFIREKKLYWCSVGDSRAYLLRGEEFVQLTKDQNYSVVIKERFNAGLIDEKTYEEESKHGEALISYLGIGNLSLIDYNAVPFSLKSGDKLVIMSDGLYKLVAEEEIHRITDNFTNNSEALLALEMKAKSSAKKKSVIRDNMTVAIINIF